MLMRYGSKCVRKPNLSALVTVWADEGMGMTTPLFSVKTFFLTYIPMFGGTQRVIGH